MHIRHRYAILEHSCSYCACTPEVEPARTPRAIRHDVDRRVLDKQPLWHLRSRQLWHSYSNLLLLMWLLLLLLLS
jgi:hypothetical protein